MGLSSGLAGEKTPVGYFFKRFEEFLDAWYMLAASHSLVKDVGASMNLDFEVKLELVYFFSAVKEYS
jgi:hypothetical protein